MSGFPRVGQVGTTIQSFVFDEGGQVFNVKNKAYGAKGNGVKVSAGNTNAMNTTAGSTSVVCTALTAGIYQVAIPFAGQIVKTITAATNPSGNIVQCTVNNTNFMWPAHGELGNWYVAQSANALASVGTDANSNPIGGGYGQPITLAGGIVTNSAGTIAAGQVVTKIAQGTPSTNFQFVNSGAPTIGVVTGSTATAPSVLVTSLTCTTPGIGTLGVAASYTITNGAAIWATDDSAAILSACVAAQAAGAGAYVYFPTGIYGVANQIIIPQGPAVDLVGENRDGVVICSLTTSVSPLIKQQCGGSLQHVTGDAALTEQGIHNISANYTNPGSTSSATLAAQTITINYASAPTNLVITDGANTTSNITYAGMSAATINTALAAATPAAIDCVASAFAGGGATGTNFVLTWNTTGDPFLVSSQFTYNGGGAAGTTTTTVTSKTLTTGSTQTIPTNSLITLLGVNVSPNSSANPGFNTTVTAGGTGTSFTLNAAPPLALVAGTANWGTAYGTIDNFTLYDVAFTHAAYAQQAFASNVQDGAGAGGNPFKQILRYTFDEIYIQECPQIQQEIINMLSCRSIFQGNVYCNDFQGRGPHNAYSYDFYTAFGSVFVNPAVTAGTGNAVVGPNTDIGNWGGGAGGVGAVSMSGPYVVADPGAVLPGSDYFNVTCTDGTFNGIVLPATVPVNMNNPKQGGFSSRWVGSKLIGGVIPACAGTLNFSGCDLAPGNLAGTFRFTGANVTSITGTYQSATTISLKGTTGHLGNIVLGMSVSDVTNPSFISSGAVVTLVTGNVITISGTVNSGMSGDTLAFGYVVNLNIDGGTISGNNLPLLSVSNASGVPALYTINLNVSANTRITTPILSLCDQGATTVNVSGYYKLLSQYNSAAGVSTASQTLFYAGLGSAASVGAVFTPKLTGTVKVSLTGAAYSSATADSVTFTPVYGSGLAPTALTLTTGTETPTGTFATASTFTVSSATGVGVGMTVTDGTHPFVPATATVTAISGTTVTVNAVVSASMSGDSLTFTAPAGVVNAVGTFATASTFTVTNAGGIFVGMTCTDAGHPFVPATATVTAVVGTTITVSSTVSASMSADTVVFAATAPTAFATGTYTTIQQSATTGAAPFGITETLTGLTPGAQYWFDYKYLAGTAGTAHLANLGFVFEEIC